VKWNVNFRERYNHGEGVVTYLAKYLRGGPINNHRIVACENEEVTFRYRINDEVSNKQGTMRLSVEQFIQRYLLHVPAPRSQSVRYYGLYAPGKKDLLDKCREIFGQLPVKETEFLDWQKFCQERGDEHPEVCPQCGKRLVRLEEIPAERKKNAPKEPRGVPLKFPNHVVGESHC
jgi:hypothetical protein